MKQENKAKIDFSSRTDLRECLDRAARILVENSNTLTSFGQDRTAQRKIRRALLKLASVIRPRWRNSLNEGTRLELRTLLEDTRRTCLHFSHNLSDKRLLQALELAVVKAEDRHKIHQFLNVCATLVIKSQELAPLIPGVVDALQLSGKDGRSRPFQAVKVSPKVLASIYGRRIFTGLEITEEPPSGRKKIFVDFLDCVWTLATNGSEAEGDWSTPVKIAALQRETGTGAGAHVLARLEADDFVRDLRRDLGIDQKGASIAPNTLC
jgi:hypothetical protein